MPRKVTCPLLFLAGSDDRINPPGTVERVAALYKDRAHLREHARHEPLADRRTRLGNRLRPRLDVARISLAKSLVKPAEARLPRAREARWRGRWP